MPAVQPMGSAVPGPFSILILLAATLAAGTPPSDSRRTLVRDVRILALEETAPATDPPPAMTIVIESGVIVAIVPAGDAVLRPGDVPVDARGAFAVPGLVAMVPTAPSYADLVRLVFDGFLTVGSVCDPAVLEWIARIRSDAPFSAAELLCVSPGAPALRTRTAGPRPGPEASRAERARWLRSNTSAVAAEAEWPDRGSIAPGQRATFLLLREDPLDDLARLGQAEQAIICGDPVRRAELETNREFLAGADRFLAELPAWKDDSLRYHIESSGLRLGRLEVAEDGRSGREAWGPPVRRTQEWRLQSSPAGWSLDGRISIGSLTRLDVAMSVGPEQIAVTAGLDEPGVPASATSLKATAEEPLTDPMSLALRKRGPLLALEPGESLRFDAVELLPVDQTIRIGVRTLVLKRLADGLPGGPAGERSLQLESLDGSELGWIRTDPTGRPTAAALFADAGITEYREAPPDPQPRKESPP